MKRNLLTAFLAIGFLLSLSAISINAQTNLLGKYDYTDKTTEGNPMNSALEIKSGNTVVFTYISVEDDYDTKTRSGTWNYNKAKNLLTITLPANTDNEDKGDDKKQIYTFKVAGRNLNWIKSSWEDNLVGKTYKKV